MASVLVFSLTLYKHHLLKKKSKYCTISVYIFYNNSKRVTQLSIALIERHVIIIVSHKNRGPHSIQIASESYLLRWLFLSYFANQ